MAENAVTPTAFAREFATISLGDRRREQRLVRIAEQCRASPDKSFPDIAPNTADLTALYRFVRSSAVTLAAILEPHVHASAVRCAEARRVLVVHDTTECEFPGDSRRNLGPLRGNDQGFLAHVALALDADGSRRPLGILGTHTWRRAELGRGRRADGARKNGGDYHKQTDKESARWWKLIDQTEDRLGGVEAIHVADREGDAFHLVRDALDHEVRFVIRMARDRLLLDDNDERLGKTSEVLIGCQDVFELEVALSRRAAKPTPRSTESARDARIAKLAVRATRARIARPNYDRDSAPSLEVNVVYVREVDPPADVEPVSWVLITTEPVDTPAQLRHVLEIYRARWMIEELFKALKTGCAFEKRQLESYETLTNALGIFLPIAWHLLLLRHQARSSPHEPAQRVLSSVQIDVLRARLPQLLPAQPTAADALRAVAYLGGHFIKRPPGWLVLGRGLEKLLDLEAGWRLARQMEPQL
jgi:Transposase DNA-binding/Transposase DDE domain